VAAGTGDLTDRRQQTDDGLSEADAIERAKQGTRKRSRLCTIVTSERVYIAMACV